MKKMKTSVPQLGQSKVYFHNQRFFYFNVTVAHFCTASWLLSDRLNSIQAFPGTSEVLTVPLVAFSTGILSSPCKQEEFKHRLLASAVMSLKLLI